MEIPGTEFLSYVSIRLTTVYLIHIMFMFAGKVTQNWKHCMWWTMTRFQKLKGLWDSQQQGLWNKTLVVLSHTVVADILMRQ